MASNEIRDPIHNFIRLDDEERKVLDSPPFQRLRQIHQLALTYLVYPGATHRRFEHSLGVMELASRIFDTVTREENRTRFAEINEIIPTGDQLSYWRRVLRLAALLHDVGHLPFSHAAESLLPAGWSHERLTVEVILDPEMRQTWTSMTPPVKPEHIVMLAVGPREIADIDDLASDPTYRFNAWQAILAEIIVGDAFGADRMDYLLRDSHHVGVAYGRFDHYRLVDTLRILPGRHQGEDSSEPELGVEEGGLQAAESLLWARYLMFTQVYFHHVRRIYDIHLEDFLKGWLSEGVFSTDVAPHLEMTDAEVISAMAHAARDSASSGHRAARAILERSHFRRVYSRNPDDQKVNHRAAQAVFHALRDEFGADNVRRSSYPGKGANVDFPVLHADGHVRSSRLVSEAIDAIPPVAVDYVYAAPEARDQVGEWLGEHKDRIIEHGVPSEEE